MRRSQAGDERAAKYFPKDRNRQEEARAGMDPAEPVRRQATHGHDAVHVGMMLETLPPRVEHHEPANSGAEAFRIRRDPKQRLRGRPKQEVVDNALVCERQARQRLRHREDDMDIADGQELRFPGRHPGVPRGGQSTGDNACRGSCCTREPSAHTAHIDRGAHRAPRCGTARSRGAHGDAPQSPRPGGSPGSDRHVGAQCRPPQRVAASPRVLQPRPPRGVRARDRERIEWIRDGL